ncbi:hypothetical protein Cgig2_007009 [Carnegiea gigantea]|uniref:anthranilate N-benzoyltransferase n=1 Tax=Carnegiea gigantea TaxID=171969 RepID=A0A9Q1KA53_9CARY|nr:hypothetical protein Cgig2_007009 [Carnegiea gigantea]
MTQCAIIKQWTMVKPAKETLKRRLWLSRLDMVVRGPFSNTPTVYVYYPTLDNKNDDANNNDDDNNHTPFFDAELLKETLSKVLVDFYPMAGRLRKDENGRLEIDCNDEGALFVETETTEYSLSDFGGFEPTLELKKLVTPSWDYSKGLSSIPLFMVQLTRFKCGGVTLGFANHHDVADGWGHVLLINSWARLVRGLGLELKPVHERAPYLAPRDPPQVKFQHVEFIPPQGLLPGPSGVSLDLEKEAVASSVFNFTKQQVNYLKQKATSSGVSMRLSTFEVLAGHIWRTTCKARKLADDQEVRLIIPMNGRRKLKNPALPLGYCGNVIFYPAYIAKAGDVTRNPLSYVASRIHETLERMNDEEYLRSTIDYLETHPNFDALVRGSHTVRCPNLSLNSWAKFNMYEADFGWGKPWFAGRAGLPCEGKSYLGTSPNEDGGYALSICLFAPHMALFEKYFYDF